MLTGVRAFQGSTGSDVMVAVLRGDPDWTALPVETPPPLRRLVRRCLEKDTRKRLRDIGDAWADLTDSVTADGAPPARTPQFSGRLMWIAGAAALAGAAGWAGAHWALGAEAVRMPVPSRIVRLTNGPAREFAPAISPDRKWVAYVATDTSGRTDVWVQFVGGGDAYNLTAKANLDITTNAGISGLEISPDGSRIAVMAKIRNSPASFATWEIPAPLGGVPRKLLDDSMLGTRWSPDGRRIAFIRAGSSAGDALWVADADGTNRREIIPADAGIHIHWPAWSTDGYIYFNRTRSTIANLDQSDVYRIRADGGTPEPIVTTPRRAMFPMVAPSLSGLFFASDSVSVDLALYWRPLAGGAAVPLTRGIGDYSAASMSLDGRAIVATYSELRQSLTRLTPNGASVDEHPITDGFSGDLDPTIAARGTRLVFSSARGGSRWLWTSELDGSGPRPLTSGDVLDQWPSISPDGGTVAFVSDRGGRRGIWLISSDGGSPRLLVHAESIGGLSWTHDGQAVVYAADYERWPGLFRVAVADGQVQRLPTAGVASDPACSPADDVVAYMRRGPAVPRTPNPLRRLPGKCALQ
jgi:Tol biopolymer transport system component